MNIIASFLILIAVILSVLTCVALIGWWRGGENVLFPGFGLIVALPAIIVLLLVLNIIVVVAAAFIKPQQESVNTTKTEKNFEYPNDIFSGCGNGTLTVSLAKNPDNYNEDTDRWLKVCINYGDLESIHDVIAPDRIKYENDGENYQKIEEENRRVFQKAALAYPMLSRINDVYADFVFTPEEVKELREECLKVKSIAENLSADLAMRKLIYACDEALTDNFYLEFSSD